MKKIKCSRIFNYLMIQILICGLINLAEARKDAGELFYILLEFHWTFDVWLMKQFILFVGLPKNYFDGRSIFLGDELNWTCIIIVDANFFNSPWLTRHIFVTLPSSLLSSLSRFRWERCMRLMALTTQMKRLKFGIQWTRDLRRLQVLFPRA